MHKLIITEQKLRESIRQILLEDDGGGDGGYGGGYGYGGGSSFDAWGGGSGNYKALYKTFVEPFTDVLKAGKLLGLDVLNVGKLNLDTVLHLFSDEERDRVFKNYTGRRREIMRQWAPLIRANNDVMSEQGAIIAFGLNPGYFLGLTLAAKTKKIPKDTLNSLKDFAGIKLPLSSFVPGTEYNDDIVTKVLRLDKKAGKMKTGLKDILGPDPDNVSHWLKTHSDVDPEDSKKSKSSGKRKEDSETLDSIFSSDKAKNMANNLMSTKDDYIKQMLSGLLKPTALLATLISAKSYDDFMNNAKLAQMSGLNVVDIQRDVKKNADALAKQQEFRDLLTKKYGDKLTDDILQKEALNTVYIQGLQPLRKKIGNVIKKQEETVMSQLMQDVPQSGSHAYDAMMELAEGKQFIMNVKKAAYVVKQIFKDPTKITKEQIDQFIANLEK